MLRCLNFWSAIKHILWVGATFIHKLLIIQSDFYLPWCFDLYQRPSSEEACSVLLVPATVVMWRGKKSVVCVAALIPVHSMPSLLLDVYHFLDPSGAPVRLPVQDCWCPTTHQKNGRRSMNRAEGSYTLSHTYDWFLATSHHHRGKNRQKNWTSFF